MARPAHTDSQQTRARILKAACELFSQDGRQVGLRDVGVRAGVSLATITHHFHSKDGLYDAAVERVHDELSELRTRLLPLLAEMPDPARALQHIIHVGWTFVREHASEVRMLMREVVATGRSDARSLERSLIPLLDHGSLLVAGLTGVEPLAARMFILSLNHLVIRYGLTHADELVLVTGVSRPEAGDAHQRAVTAVEEHLVAWSLAQLGVHTRTRGAS